jgi:hypothetical protein
MPHCALDIFFTDIADFTPHPGDVRSVTCGPVNPDPEARDLVDFTVTLTVDKSQLGSPDSVVTGTLDV